MTTAFYRFNASDDAISDPNNVWSNDANLIDADISSHADPSATGSPASNYLFAGGTNAPTDRTDMVTRVRARIRGYPDSGKWVKATIYTDGLGESLGEVACYTGASGGKNGDWLTLTVPTGGWTWAKVAALEFKCYGSASGQWAYQIDLRVDSGALYYEFDGSDDAASDPNSVWSNDASAVDGSYLTQATCNTTGSTASNYLRVGGTNAPTTGVDTVTEVKVRIYAAGGASCSCNAAVYTDGLAELLGTASKNGSESYSDWATLTVPSGGWTWAKVAALEFKAFRTVQQTPTTIGLYVVEVEVSYEAVSDTLTASGASTSAGTAVLHQGYALAASGASSSAGTARLTRYGANFVGVTQAGLLVDAGRTPPMEITQAGALLDAIRTPPVEVTQAGALLDAKRTPPVQVTQAGAIVDMYALSPVKVTAAGLMVDARYVRPETTYNCWEFHVYTRSGTYLTYFDNAFQTAYLEQLNECGGGAFVLPAGDAKATAANLAAGNVVRPRYRNVEIGAFTIDDVEEVLIAEGEGQAQLLKVSGRGLIGTLDHALVYPADAKSLTPPERVFTNETKAAIWLALYNEFIARGGGELNMGFWAAEDSAGLAWNDTISVTYRAGQTMLDVLRQLCGLGMDVTVDPDRTMLAFNSLGRDLSDAVVFRKGHNILSSTKKTLGSDLANVVLGAAQESLVESTDATSVGVYGRREVYLPVQNTPSMGLVTTANGLLLDEYKVPRTAITLEVTARELFPFFDYDIGDTVRVVIPEEDGSGQEIDADYRIYSISVREGQGPCDLRVTLELNSLEAEYLIKLQKALRASLLSVPPSSGSASSLASSTTASPASADGGNLADDSIQAKHVDWGTGLGQVSAADVPIADAGGYFSTDNVEAALQAVGSDIAALESATGGIVTDHGGLTGLADDDHTQYLLADGTRTGATAGGAQQFVGGLRVGGDTNYFYVTGSGEVSLNGAATQWDDLRLAGSSVRLGVTAPTLGAFGPSGNLRTLRFDAGQHDEIEFEIQMPHSWKLGTKIYPHVHWAPVSATAGNVVWELEYAWANVDGTFGAPGSMASDAQAAGGTAWVHKLAVLKSGGNAWIDGTGKTLSSMLVCRLHRNAGAGSDTLAADVAFLEFDLHYEVDSFGSNEEYTK